MYCNYFYCISLYLATSVNTLIFFKNLISKIWLLRVKIVQVSYFVRECYEILHTSQRNKILQIRSRPDLKLCVSDNNAQILNNFCLMQCLQCIYNV